MTRGKRKRGGAMPFNIRTPLPGPITYTKRIGGRSSGRGCGTLFLIALGFGLFLMIPMPARVAVLAVAVLLLVVLWIVKGGTTQGRRKGGRGGHQGVGGR
jgi:hypothetical protein